jgi:hypothetical protein
MYVCMHAACMHAHMQPLLPWARPCHAAIYQIISCLTSCFVLLQALSAIFFLSFVVQILYYYGIMQWVVIKLGWLIQVSMGTTVCESANAAASVFLGMVIRRCTFYHDQSCRKQALSCKISSSHSSISVSEVISKRHFSVFLYSSQSHHCCSGPILKISQSQRCMPS